MKDAKHNSRIDWEKLIGTSVLCRHGIGNHPALATDRVCECRIQAVRGKFVQTCLDGDNRSGWYTIMNDGHLGEGDGAEGFHIEVITDDI